MVGPFSLHWLEVRWYLSGGHSRVNVLVPCCTRLLDRCLRLLGHLHQAHHYYCLHLWKLKTWYIDTLISWIKCIVGSGGKTTVENCLIPFSHQTLTMFLTSLVKHGSNNIYCFLLKSSSMYILIFVNYKFSTDQSTNWNSPQSHVKASPTFLCTWLIFIL